MEIYMSDQTCDFIYMMDGNRCNAGGGDGSSGGWPGDGGLETDVFFVPERVDGKVVTGIAPRAFYGCKSLKQVFLPETVKSIGSYAFAECRGLEKLHFPGSVERIGDYAFYNCMGLHEISIGRDMTSIGYGAFKNCLELSRISMDIVQGRSHCLNAILQDEFQEVDVRLNYLDEAGKVWSEARLVFTDYQYEYVPEIEARQFNWETYGSGESYRVSIRGTDIDYLKYDSVFPVAMVEDDARTLIKIVAGRLCFPHKLAGGHRVKYENYVKENIDSIMEMILSGNNAPETAALLLEYILNHRLLEQAPLLNAIKLAHKYERPEITAQLMAYGGQPETVVKRSDVRTRFSL